MFSYSGLAASTYIVWLAALFATATFAHAKQDGFLIGGEGYKLDRRDAIVIIYTHGSAGNGKKDKCRPTTGQHYLDQVYGNSRIPRVLETLAHDDPRIALFYVCHDEVSTKPELDEENKKTVPCEPKAGIQPAKFCKRVNKIKKELLAINDNNKWLKNSRIFLAGGSSGGWTSLILSGKKPGLVAGVIAFAPATNGKLGLEWKQRGGKTDTAIIPCGRFKGKKIHRPLTNSKKRYFRHLCQEHYISRTVPSALVFAHEGDFFNPPKLLPNLQSVPHKIEFHITSKDDCGFILRLPGYLHSCHQTRTFEQMHLKTIRTYINQRLGETGQY